MVRGEMGDMGDVIVLSSDNDEEESDVEVLGSYGHFMTKADPLPLTAVKVHVDALNVSVPKGFINLADSKWTLSHLKKKRINSTVSAVVDLTEDDTENVSEEVTENVRSDSFPGQKSRKNESPTINKQDGNLQPRSSSDPNVPHEDYSSLKWRQKYLDSQNKQKQTTEEDLCGPVIQLERLPFLEKYATEMNSINCSVLTKHCTPVSMNICKEKTSNNLRTTFASNGLHTELPLDEPPQASPVRKGQLENGVEFKSKQLYTEISQSEDIRDDFKSDMPVPSPSWPLSSEKSVHSPFQSKLPCFNPEKLISDKAESVQCPLSHLSSIQSLATRLTHPGPNDLDCLHQRSPKSQDLMSQDGPVPTSELTEAEKTCKWEMMDVKANEESNSSDLLHWNFPDEPPLSGRLTEAMDSRSGSWYHGQDQGSDSPRSFFCEEETDGEQVNTENRFEMDFRAASGEDRHFVCPVTLKKIMSGRAQALIDEKEGGLGSPEVICHHSLNLVNCTIDVNYPEGTLQLLSDLLQPGFYPPKDIIVHLLRGIVLDPQCPYHLCVQAFGLLMKTQRHHIADKKTVPWDWELVTSCMDNQDDSKRHRTEVVRMLLEYTVQTLEDDFRAKCSFSTARHSIAKATLSCDQHFSNVRDVVKWLFSAIIKSTENGESREAARERDEQIRIVYILQRMLSLALEVDCSPTLTSAKLSQELFHMLIGNEPQRPQRAHRMLLLECLQSQLLRCKLLEHLLDYVCPVKTPAPMSLRLLLHFLKNCTLEPDPSDGTERWKKWEELVHLLWMLLLSYNKAMKGYLCSAVGKQREIVGTLVYKQDDMVSKTDVREAMEAFLSRSKADLGQDLPLHVEESLSYLQDYLLNVCQC